ncbi:MAG: anaerobic ribonucleoside-triphosphate reductase activating protein [Candidatus Sumerlaeota bacterium]
MKISGLTKCSMVDYPGKMAAVVFTPGCNMACYYCHNHWLKSDSPEHRRFEEEDVLKTIERRKDFLDGVVITGGEPTLQSGLERFILDIRAMGLSVKLDTNGTRPDILQDLVENRMVDYVAMDIKAPPEKYESICGLNITGMCGGSVDLEAVEASITALIHGKVDYEFRTTFAPELTRADLRAMGNWIRGAKRYVLQQYRPVRAEWFGQEETLTDEPLPSETIIEWAGDIRHLVGELRCRGLGVETIDPPRATADYIDHGDYTDMDMGAMPA